jgi:hypothetical protein
MTLVKRLTTDEQRRKITKATEMFLNLVQSNVKEIDYTLWFLATISTLAVLAEDSGWSKELFIKEMNYFSTKYAEQLWEE